MIAARAVFAGLLVAAFSAGAQQPTQRGQIQGVVTDSVHHRPLAGALIFATRTSPQPPLLFGAAANDRGRYVLDTLPAGSYQISIVAPFLDSASVVLPPREITIGPGERRDVDLATPSGATLRAAACPGLQLPPGRGAIYGEIVDADNERPLGGARVVVMWREISVDRATLRVASTERVSAVAADSGGNYRLCGVPTGTPLFMQVQSGQAAGAPVSVVVDDSLGRGSRSFSFSRAEARLLSDTVRVAGADTVRPHPLTGTATLTGVVHGLGGTPVSGANIRVVDAASSAITDSLGRFELRGLPAGSQVAEVRRLGYSMARAAVELRRGSTASVDVELSRPVSLDSVRVIAQRSRYAEFEQRRHSAGAGFGKFLEAADVERWHPFETSDLLKTVNGMRVEGTGLDAVVVSTRNTAASFLAQCNVNVIINGIPNMSINMVEPSQIGAMEIYAGDAGVPPQYTGLANPGCGAIIIWSKR